MKIAVGFDRRGARLRAAVIGELLAQGHEVLDLGMAGSHADGDYAVKAREAARVVLEGRVDRGGVVSRSAVGASFVANKVEGIRAGACSDTYTAKRGAELGMNLLCLGTQLLTRLEVTEIVRAFVGAKEIGTLAPSAAIMAQSSRRRRSASHAA